jgi:hypothetical protein
MVLQALLEHQVHLALQVQTAQAEQQVLQEQVL